MRDIRDQQWLQRQPPTVRAGLKGLSAAQCSQRVARLRTEQRQRLRLVLDRFGRSLSRPG